MQGDTVTRRGIAVVVALFSLAATASAGTSFVSTWKSPAAGPLRLKGQKVMALVLGSDPAVRQGAEDVLAQELTRLGAVGLPTYSIVPKELMQDKAQARPLVEQAGILAVVSMRVVEKSDDMSSTPPSAYYSAPHYATFWTDGYYGYTSNLVVNTGYVRMDTVVVVEVLVHSLAQDKLVWAGRSSTTNPKDVGKFVRELTDRVAGELKKAGLIGK